MLWRNIEQGKKDKSEERCYFIDREVTEKASPKCHLRRDLHIEKNENFREKEEIACAKALCKGILDLLMHKQECLKGCH